MVSVSLSSPGSNNGENHRNKNCQNFSAFLLYLDLVIMKDHHRMATYLHKTVVLTLNIMEKMSNSIVKRFKLNKMLMILWLNYINK